MKSISRFHLLGYLVTMAVLVLQTGPIGGIVVGVSAILVEAKITWSRKP